MSSSTSSPSAAAGNATSGAAVNSTTSASSGTHKSSKSPSLRRIQADIRELAFDPSPRYHAAPLETDMFEWHFTIRGADDTDFAGGIYHGRILLPPEYPYKPPHILFLTPTGRFQCHTKICLSFSAYHPELWQPAWGIRLILEALIAFLPTPADGAVGAMNATPAQRQKLAAASVHFRCAGCGPIVDLLPPVVPAVGTANAETTTTATAAIQKSRFHKEIEQLQQLQLQNHAARTDPETNLAETDTSATVDMENQQYSSEPGHEAKATTTVESEERATPTSSSFPIRTPQSSTAGPGTSRSPPPHSATNTDTSSNQRVQTPVPPPTTPLEQPVPPRLVPPLLPNDHSRGERWTWWVDPLLQLSIAIMAIICYILLRKIELLLDDLRRLED